jgi:hypothetical protein
MELIVSKNPFKKQFVDNYENFKKFIDNFIIFLLFSYFHKICLIFYFDKHPTSNVVRKRLRGDDCMIWYLSLIIVIICWDMEEVCLL